MRTRELKKYRIRPATAPQRHSLLSGVVRVCDSGRGVAYVEFDEKLVDAVGMALPQGVSPDSPAYLKAVKAPTGAWRVYAMYARAEKGALMWESKDTPTWLTTVKRSEHVTSASSGRGRD